MVEELETSSLPATREAKWFDSPEDWRKEVATIRPKAFQKSMAPAVLTAVATMIVLAPFVNKLGAFIVVPALFASLFAMYRSYHSYFDRELQRKLLGPPQDQVLEWEVFLDIVQGGIVTGRDRGRVWVEDGQLMFLGRRTSFSITSDLLPVARAISSYTGISGSTAGICTIRIRNSLTSEPTKLRFRVLWRTCDCWTGMTTFKNEVFKLYSTRREGGQLPPLWIGPGAETRWDVATRNLVTAALAAAVGVSAVALFMEGAAVPAAIVILAASVALARSMSSLQAYSRIMRRQSAKPLSQVAKLV